MDAFRDRVVLITGAASGIGRELALQLARHGARVGALDLQREGLDRLRGELPGPAFGHAVADVTDLAGLREAVARLEAQLGPTDLLIACAGLGRETSALAFSAEEVNAILDVNLLGMVNSFDTVLAGMRQRGRGHLVALSSLASFRGLPRMAGYCASKAGVNALCDALRVELRPLGIAVTTVCPGWIRTPMTAPLPLPEHLLMSVEEAARRILWAVRRRRPFLAFPARPARLLGLLRLLPLGWSDWLTHREGLRYDKLRKN